MTPESSALFGILLDSSLRMIAVAVGVGSILTVARVRSAGVRHAAWTAVLGSMLLMPILPQVIPAVGIPIPAAHTRVTPGRDLGLAPMPAPRPAPDESELDLPTPSTVAPAPSSPVTGPAARTTSSELRVSWARVAWMLYGSGVFFFVARLGMGWRLMRRLVSASRPANLPEARAVDIVPGPPAGTLPRAVSRARIVESSAVATPLTTGILSPVVILPDDWREWPEEKLRAVLAHEFAHVGRRDPLVALAACLNRAVFWFHPLAWWLARTLAVTAEDACDDAAVGEAGTPRRYAEVLLDMVERVRRQGGRVAWQGVGVDGTGFLGQRIDRILTGSVLREVSMVRKVIVALGCASAILLVTACQPEQVTTVPPLKPDPKVTEDDARQAASNKEYQATLAMTAEQVAALESSLQRNPEDLGARKRLLVFYRLAWQKAVGWDEAVAASRRHVLWIIEHRPAELMAYGYAKINPAHDPAGYAQARKLWLSHISKPDAPTDVLSNAACFFEAGDKPLAGQILLRLQAKDPGGPQPRVKDNVYRSTWSSRLGGLYAMAMLGGSDEVWALVPAEARSPFAREARKQLEATTDAAILTGAAEGLERERFRDRLQTVAGTLDFDPGVLAESYLNRAIELDPKARNPRILLFRLHYYAREHALAEKLRGVPQEKQAVIVSALPDEERIRLLPNRTEMEYGHAEYLDYQKHDAAAAAASWAQSRKYADDLLQLAAKRPDDPERGTAIFVAHTILGALALRDNDKGLALRHMAEAGNAPPSEPLRYGASLTWSRLCVGLLKRGERETVAAFLDRFAQVNEGSRDYLIESAAQIRAGTMPVWYPPRVEP